MARINGVFYYLALDNTGMYGGKLYDTYDQEQHKWVTKYEWRWDSYGTTVCEALQNASPSSPVDIIFKNAVGEKFTFHFTQAPKDDEWVPYTGE